MFEETTPRLSAKLYSPIVGDGLSMGDLDNDGQLDLVIVDYRGKQLNLCNMSSDADLLHVRQAGV
jgi:hypothetical protein